MSTEELAPHVPFATVTERSIGPGALGEKVIDLVPVPVVMVPFVSVHAYVAPAPPSGTDAAYGAPMQTTVGALMTAEGVISTVTSALPVPLPPQEASATARTVYDVDVVGLTTRLQELVPIAVSV